MAHELADKPYAFVQRQMVCLLTSPPFPLVPLRLVLSPTSESNLHFDWLQASGIATPSYTSVLLEKLEKVKINNDDAGE